MGILNITPDSFFGDSRVNAEKNILERAGQMLSEGACILDVGGQSTRPGATRISADEELQRVIPAIRQLVKEFPNAILSVDTFYGSVARAAAGEGVQIINDVSAGEEDPEMFEFLPILKLPYILMHKQGSPEQMQQAPRYNEVTLDIIEYFSYKVAQLRAMGVADIILDPGFGFGKSLSHNYQLMSELDWFKIFELPVLVGISRKSMVQKLLHVTAEEALNGSSALHMVALLKGAKILRVHDVKEAVQCINIYQALQK